MDFICAMVAESIPFAFDVNRMKQVFWNLAKNALKAMPDGGRLRVTAHGEGPGSVLVSFGDTRVICTAKLNEKAPPFLRNTGKGWITAEYGMLPRSTLTRTPREQSSRSGRTAEIQRLIGRSLRAVCRLDLIGERTFVVDCDVLRADGGTRTAAITGAYVALTQALYKMTEGKNLPTQPLRCAVAAVSAGILDGIPLLDLNYEEDYKAAVDFNVVMTEEGELVEVQGTGESHSFTREEMSQLLDLSEAGIRQLFEAQRRALAQAGLGVASSAK